MVYKHNKRNWKYRTLAMLAGYRFRVPVFTVPAPLFVGGLIYTDPAHVNECVACGMDASMQHDLELCPKCGCCVAWEDPFGAVSSCCTCGHFSPEPTDLDPQSMVLEALS